MNEHTPRLGTINASPATIAEFAALSEYFDRVFADPDEHGRKGHTPQECPDRLENVSLMLTAAALASSVRDPVIDSLSEFFNFLRVCHGAATAMGADIPVGKSLRDMVAFLAMDITEGLSDDGPTIN